VALHQGEKTMFRVLITQFNPDGSIKEVNGVKQIGGVVFDRIGEALGHVYDESKYDASYNRKKENYVEDWYRSEK
jgi:hypothetical protein